MGKSKSDGNQIGLFGDSTTGQKRESVRGGTSTLSDLLSKYEKPEVNKYVSREFQDYGYRLACEMGEEKKKGMYIRLAKTLDRSLLERARSFVIDAPNVDNKGKLFMWAVGRLKKGESLVSDEEKK